MTTIEVRGLTKVFNDRKLGPVHAVEGVSFDAQGGQVFGLLGLNGAGKTTTLRMLATVLKPTSGIARVAGHDITAHPDQVRREIGYLSGDTRLYDRLTAQELLVYFGQLAGLEVFDARARARYLLGRFGLEESGRRHISQLSTGTKQRINLARAMISDPPVLILDEPTAGLDVLGAREVGQMILGARGEGRCVLLSTHIMREAERLCEEVAIIHRGRILAQGPPAALSAGHTDLEDAFVALVAAAEKEAPLPKAPPMRASPQHADWETPDPAPAPIARTMLNDTGGNPTGPTGSHHAP